MATPWWGSFTLHEGQMGHWRLGATDLWLARKTGEWTLWTEQVRDPLDDTAEVSCPSSQAYPSDDLLLTRLTTSQGDQLHILPATSDRPVVARPEQPLRLLPQEKTTLFVQTSLWFTMRVGQHNDFAVDIPIWRPSDTWFGDNLREGELCYATRTRARLALDKVPTRGSRALTVVQIHHKGDTPLLLERVKLPMRWFSLFHDATGRIWTDTVTVTTGRHTHNTIEASLGAPPQAWAGSLETVSTPRDGARGLGRVFSVLLG